MPLNWAERLVPKKSKNQGSNQQSAKKVYTITGLEYTPEMIAQENATFNSYESDLSGTERSLAFAYAKLMPTPVGVTRNSPPDRLTPQQKSELRLRILTALQQQDGTIQYPDDSDYDAFSQELFGMSASEFTEQLKQREGQTSESGKKAFRLASSLQRLLPEILKTNKEIQYKTNVGKFECRAYTEYTNTYSELHPNTCILVANTIYALFKTLSVENSKVLYICVAPQFFQGTSRIRYTTKYYNVDINTLQKVFRVPYKHFFATSFIQDAFEQGGVWLFHPRMFVLLQDSADRDKLEGKYIMPRLDRIDRITIATLQKYAAIRRFIWTKNVEFAARIYKDDLRSLAAELRSPYITLPAGRSVLPGFSRNYQALSSAGATQEQQDYAKSVPYFAKFDEVSFLKEFRENQVWAGGEVRYSSYSDPRLDAILPMPEMPRREILASGEVTNPAYTTRILPWLKDETFRARQDIPMPRLPEESNLAAHKQALSVFGLNNNNTPETAPIVSPTPPALTRATALRRIANRSKELQPGYRSNLRRLANAANATEELDDDEIDKLENLFNVQLRD